MTGGMINVLRSLFLKRMAEILNSFGLELKCKREASVKMTE